MKISAAAKLILIVFLFVVVNYKGTTFAQPKGSTVNEVASTPPMGWNSYDAFGNTITEAQFKTEVKFMKKNLLRYGWKYAVIDYLWFNPDPGGWKKTRSYYEEQNIRLDKNGRPIDSLTMDKYGRLLPAVNRFPSAAGGKGFKPIADFVHKLGLKFGFHIMRGIPRQAYWDNTPVKGTSYTAREIADTNTSDLCKWNNNMYGVDPGKPGAQEYYNSLFDLYAKWGADFIKVDDIARPYHKGEIEMIRKAIDQCGRPMVLSLSPGAAPLSEAVNLIKNANMWRVADDMWDNWKDLKLHFNLFNDWSPYIQKNHFPDGDMLPIGHLSLNGRPVGPDRMSHLTKDETYTLLSLWCIARSPLIMGGELLTSSRWVISLLQNKEVIEVDQHSTDNHQVFRNEDEAIWMAEGTKAGVIYLAMFNLEDKPQTIEFNFDSVPGMKGSYKVRNLLTNKNLGISKSLIKASIGPHGAELLKLGE